jgi:RHS repeat-associated protein
VTASKTFVYDSATVNGTTMAYAEGRLAEAYTGSSSSKSTDLGFSYSPRGEVASVLESTPNSSGYYQVSATYWANGLVNMLSGLGLPNLTYTPEGEGRIYSVGASNPSGQNPLTSTSYTPYAIAPNPNLVVTLGSGDSDQSTYDLNTGRMTSYQFNVGSPVQSVVGNLTWNANGTLNQLAITDPFNSSNQQTCSYAYDDLARLASANCGSVWSQTFSSDAFGNLSKTGTITFQPTYSTSTNQVSNVGGSAPTYDANGNLLKDGVNTYTWDGDGNLLSASSTYNNVALTFDALDRMVEQNRSGSYTQIVYGPGGGKLALMNGQTLAKAFVPLSGGATAVYNSSGLAYYRHADWLGSSRFASYAAGGSQPYYDGAYAPYGENYAEIGTQDRNFTGMNQDTIASGPYPLYDGLFREYHPTWGRWVSPDPAGLAAVNPSGPQTWNRYAYVMNNPTGLTDPLGLCQPINGIPCHPVYEPSTCDGIACNSGSAGNDPFLGLEYLFIEGFEGGENGDAPTFYYIFNPDAAYLQAFGPGGGGGGLAILPLPTPSPVLVSLVPASACPLEAPTGNYTIAPRVVALFQPPMTNALSSAIGLLNSQGIVPMITGGFRTADQQAALQGSPYGAAQVSWHQVGMAVDINSMVPNFQTIVNAMTGSGLTWGGTFIHPKPDPVHFQYAAPGTNPSAAQLAACSDM